MSTTTITVSPAQVRAARALLADAQHYGAPRDGMALIADPADPPVPATTPHASRRVSQRRVAAQ